MAFAAFGMEMLSKLAHNTSDRIGSGASLRRQMSREQVAQTQAEAKAGILGRVEGAKAAGLHPLVAMGSNVGGATLPVGNSFNSSAGDGFIQSAIQKRELEARREELDYQRAAEKDARKAAAEAQALNNAETVERTNLLKVQQAAEAKRMVDSDRDFQAYQAAQIRQAAAHQVPLRVPNRGTTVKPMYVPVRDRHGRIQHIPNPDIYDLELPETVGAGTLVLPEIGPNADKSPAVMDRISNWWEQLKAADRRQRARMKSQQIRRP